MNLHVVSVLVLLLASTALAHEDLGVATEEPTFSADWKHGLRVRSDDGQFDVRTGGRLMHDWLFSNADDDLDVEDGAMFRRVRFHSSGTLYEVVDFKLQFDFSNGDAGLKDAYIRLNDLPVGQLQIGHYYEPYTLSAMVSSKFYTFMENPPSVNAFSPIRNTGLMIMDHAVDERVSWNLGVFRDANDRGRVTDPDLFSFTGRLTGLPVYEDGGRRLVHMGVSGGYRILDGEARYRARPSNFIAPFFIDTSTTVVDPETGEETVVDIPGDESWLYALESAATFNSLSLMAEITGTTVNSDESESYSPMGWFIDAGYFLTGEFRRYKKSTGRYTRLVPLENYGKGGWGAWEAAARYSSVDLNDADVTGGKMDEVMLGLNWYLNPAVRFMLNYSYADVQDTGTAHLVGTRFQVEF